jgi:signal transduction histidine kinase
MLIDLENFKTEQVGWSDVLRQLDTMQDSTRQVLSSLRQLLHAVGALVTRFEEKTDISVQLTVLPGWPELISQPASINLYRIIEEALANVRMHSGAREVRIVLQSDSDGEVSVRIGDDGRGLDTDGSKKMGFGTVGMRERALLLGGRIRIDSQEGDGTTVLAVFPKDVLTAIASRSQNTPLGHTNGHKEMPV